MSPMQYAGMSKGCDEEMKARIKDDLLSSSLDGLACDFGEVIKSPGYLSNWKEDVVTIDLSTDRYDNEVTNYDLSKTYLQCRGPMSLFDNAMPLTAFPNLTFSAKVYLNILDKTFRSSTKKKSEITQNFNNLCRFMVWMIQARGVYRLGSLTRQDFHDFIAAMSDSGGWANLLNLDLSLREIIRKLETGEIDICDVSSTMDHSGQASISIREKYLERHVGIPGVLGSIPIWFYVELNKYHNNNYTVNACPPKQYSFMTCYSHIKSLNRLSLIPSGFDRPAFRPFSFSINQIKKKYFSSNVNTNDGRTLNLNIEDAIKIFKESLLWIDEYSSGVFKILELYRDKLEKCKEIENLYSHKWIQGKISNNKEINRLTRKICIDNKLPFDNVVFDKRSHLYDEQSRPSIECLVKNILTSCFIIIATNHGRRLNEIVGEHNLPYGLYFGCVEQSETDPELNLIDIYIEKTIKDWGTFYVNKLVLKAVGTLEDLSQFHRPLFSDKKTRHKSKVLARKDKLFVYRPFTLKGFNKKPFTFRFSATSASFLKRAGVNNQLLDNRSHPFRRFFSLLYYYRYDLPDLLALSDHLCHLDPGMTQVYLTDPEMRSASDAIQELYKSRIDEENRKFESDLEDVHSEVFTKKVLDILKGEFTGGAWPKVVLAVYKNMAEFVDFNELSLEERGVEVSRKLLEQGYSRTPYEHGGCNVGKNDITISKAHCNQGVEGAVFIEDASPECCHGCPHFDCNHQNLKVLENRSAELLSVENNPSVPLPVRAAAKEERFSLNQIVKAELKIGKQNLKLLNDFVDGFARLTSESFENVEA